MNFSNVFPVRFHPFLKWLGKLDPWLRVGSSGEISSYSLPDRDKLESAPDHATHRPLLDKLTQTRDGMLLFLLDALGACLANGPKMFHPTVEQFDAMQHVEIHLPIKDYAQPYPAMLVKIPPESRRGLSERVGLPLQEAPHFALVRLGKTEDGKNYVFVHHPFDGYRYENAYVFQDRPLFTTVEDALLTLVLKSKDEERTSHRWARESARACLNLMLLLTRVGCRVVRDRPQGKHIPQKTHAADIRTVEMVQHVRVRAEVREGKPLGEPTGREMPPHWRKGHWRAAPGYAKDRAEGRGVPLVLVRPCLVRGDRAAGDLADSSAVYVQGGGM